MTAPPRRYLDNAATSFPKPPAVTQAIVAALEGGASAGRGAYREAVAAGQTISACRSAVARLMNCAPRDHVVFGHNGTDMLNLALKALLRPGDHVVTTSLEHNSVLRPLHALHERVGVTITIVQPDPQSTLLDPAALADALTPGTRLLVVNHASNVTGALQPIAEIAATCRARGVLLLVDAAQSAGHVPIDFTGSGVDLLACSGHKGLLGPLGTGVLCIRDAAAGHLRSVREGGTGSASEQPRHPEALPDRLEAGSHNAVGLAGLLAGVNWLLERGATSLRAHEMALCARFMSQLDAIAGLRSFGPRDPTQRVGVFSITLPGLDPAELTAILEEQFGVLTRSGLHCAPLAHQMIGTAAAGGTTRLSFGPFTKSGDVDAAAAALLAIGRSVASA